MSFARVLAAGALAVLVSACAGRKPRPEPPRPEPPVAKPAVVPETSLPQSQRYRRQKDAEPDAVAVDIAKLVEPQPKNEPRARYGNRSPYSVLGKTYTVLPEATGYVERGISSWYGAKFHGYMTSSLEPYDMYQFSAAHKSLPLPSYVRVTNLANGKSVVVRVNDRGPFHENRLIDLSYAAAVRIGVWPKGTGLVEVRAIDATDGAPAPRAPVAATADAHGPRIYLQLGAFADRANAERVEQGMRREKIGPVSIETTRINDREIHRVRLGPMATVEAADALGARVERLGFGTPRVAIAD